MLFNSLEFLLFLVVVYGLYYALRGWQRSILLVASLFFYGWWNPPYLLLVLVSVLVDYTAAQRIVDDPIRRRTWLVLSVVTNLGILGSFKYYDFMMENATALLAALGVEWVPPEFSMLLPMGISFYTFQSMSYTIDVYRGNFEPERRFRRFLLYVTFFPQMVAGPIMRPQHLIPQFRDGVRLDPENIAQGMTQIARGYAKKLFFADALAPYVNRVFANPSDFDGGQSLVAVYAFALQIYGDFAGYSDIAIGVGRTLGYDVTKNFDHPYKSRSITEFWRRWHLSLSSWLRDYLYISLGGNRRGRRRTTFNLMMTMLLGGLWHGAGWNFVIWGGLHGGMLAVERALGIKSRVPGSRLRQWFNRLLTFHLVCLTWIFFRAETFEGAMAIIRNIATGAFSWGTLNSQVLALIALFFVLHEISAGANWRRWSRRPWAQAAAAAAMLFACIIMFRRVPSEFIYFQF